MLAAIFLNTATRGRNVVRCDVGHASPRPAASQCFPVKARMDRYSIRLLRVIASRIGGQRNFAQRAFPVTRFGGSVIATEWDGRTPRIRVPCRWGFILWNADNQCRVS